MNLKGGVVLGSSIVDVVIGLILLFFLSSVAAAAINEVAEGIMKRRARYLEATIERIVGADLVQDLYGTSWIRSISRNAGSFLTPDRLRMGEGRAKPSYIAADVFASAVREVLETFTAKIDDALVAFDDDHEVDALLANLPARFADVFGGDIPDVDEIRAEVKRLEPMVRAELVDRFPRGVLDGLDDGAYELRRWYEHAMDRMSGWYGRQTRWLLLVWGLLLAIGLNLDSFAVASNLWSDDAAREAAFAAAQAAVDGGDSTDCTPADNDPYSCVSQAVSEIRESEALGMPIGWPDWPWKWGDGSADSDPRLPQNVSSWVLKLAGVLVTGAAVSLGSPFWFNLLNKFVNFRAAGPKPRPTT